MLLLLFLPGFTAEVLTGSTPILAYLTNPVSLIFNVLLYGCGALLVREVARRNGFGWVGILLLGAAYGIFEEGLVINTWADPWATQVCSATATLCNYSRVLGINTLWALSLTTFHAIVSITIPILLVEQTFPRVAARPWLDRKALIVCVAGELLCLAAGILLNFSDFRWHGQNAPLLLPYLIEVALMAVFVALAFLTRQSGPPALPPPFERRVPRQRTLRLFGFFALFAAIGSPYVFNGLHIHYLVALEVSVAVLALGGWRVITWSKRIGWTDRQRLALASGALGFLLLVWDPFLELSGSAGGKMTHGTLLVAVAYFVYLIVLSRLTDFRVRREVAAMYAAMYAPVPATSYYSYIPTRWPY